MYNPCYRCKCILRRDVCRKFCNHYKTALSRWTGLELYNQRSESIKKAKR